MQPDTAGGGPSGWPCPGGFSSVPGDPQPSEPGTRTCVRGLSSPVRPQTYHVDESRQEHQGDGEHPDQGAVGLGAHDLPREALERGREELPQGNREGGRQQKAVAPLQTAPEERLAAALPSTSVPGPQPPELPEHPPPGVPRTCPQDDGRAWACCGAHGWERQEGSRDALLSPQSRGESWGTRHLTAEPVRTTVWGGGRRWQLGRPAGPRTRPGRLRRLLHGREL